jgi:hypothetical protein
VDILQVFRVVYLLGKCLNLLASFCRQQAWHCHMAFDPFEGKQSQVMHINLDWDTGQFPWSRGCQSRSRGAAEPANPHSGTHEPCKVSIVFMRLGTLSSLLGLLSVREGT